ncbi:MAG: AAA family ATPase [Candidatus Aminicenantes bacterium]|nr:AAA family ATPase [Candidatus Aminicenantes bacterium]
MNILFSNLKKINNILSYFVPRDSFEKKELNKKNSELLIRYLTYILDALIKSECMYKKRNFILPDGESFFPENLIDVMSNVNLYLYKFETKILSFTRTERHTFVFIIENLIDYLKNNDLYLENSDRKNLFVDYRFWIENFFKIFDQKMNGLLYSGKSKVNLKNIFNANDPFKNSLIYSNSIVSFTLFPFVINKGNQVLFLSEVTDRELVYKDIELEKEVKIRDKSFDIKVFEFLVSNFDFKRANLIKGRIQDVENLLVEKSEIIETAYAYHNKKHYAESFNLLRELPFEEINLPLLYLLQIKNLVNLNRIFEVKKVMQNFIHHYPYYAEGYEVMGDIYLKEENFDMALSFYEKVLKIAQNKRVSEKIKRVKETISKNKEKVVKHPDEYFFDITGGIFQDEEEIILREKELREMMEILISKSRRNIILVGESGVGKTALIRLLSRRMLDGDVPDPLKNKRVKEINFVSLLTGSKYRGQFEEKVLKLLTEFKSQNAILVLEDIHLMIASGVARGTSLDLVNILKQFLRENSIQVIATTNYEEFKNTIERDNTLPGFFQKIIVNELSVEGTVKILKTLAKNIFLKEEMIVSDETISDIAEVAKRNIRDKKLPDSAIMVLERAVSKVKYKVHVGETNEFKINQADIMEVLSDILNLPESDIPLSLKNRLIHLQENLRKEIVGQDDSLEKITGSIITSKMNFDIKPNRPDGVFLFIGPTGVGKTETAIALTKALYGMEDYLIRIDMSEYMEKFTYSRFVGAAPGYVGYMDTNQLTDKVRQNPFSVILLDEIEKADSQLLNIFLQVFDAGRLTDARGNVVDFSHTTIIMTSNIGTALFSKAQMGYQGDVEGSNVSRQSLIKALKKYFSPEFLNRVDEILVFKHLDEDNIKKIIEIQLEGTIEYLKKIDKELVFKEEVIDYLIKAGYSKEYGARHISRALKSNLLEKIAKISLKKEWEYAKHIVCSLYEDEIEVSLEPAGTESVRDEEFMEQNQAARGAI